MTETQRTKLIAQRESDTLEFKKTTAEREAATRTLCGMLNGSGGRVLISVTEAGKIRGQMISDGTLKELARAYTQFEPSAAIGKKGFQPSTGLSKILGSRGNSITQDSFRRLVACRGCSVGFSPRRSSSHDQ